MVSSIMLQSRSTLNNDAILQHCIHTIGGIPRKYALIYEHSIHSLNHAFTTQIDRDPEGMVAQTVRNIEENMPNLVSFTESFVDQTLWERESDALPVVMNDGGRGVEVDSL